MWKESRRRGENEEKEKKKEEEQKWSSPAAVSLGRPAAPAGRRARPVAVAALLSAPPAARGADSFPAS